MSGNPYGLLEPAALLEAARTIARPRDPTAHWTQLAALLGAVDDRSLYVEFGHRSTRAWAEAALDLSPADTGESLRLWRVVQASQLEIEAWLPVSKGKALVVARALALGGNPAQWIALALAAKTEDDLRDALRRQLGKEVWVELVYQVPQEVAELVEAALTLAVLQVWQERQQEEHQDMTLTDTQPTAEEARALATDRRWAFRCLERLATSYVQQHPGGGHP